ncbi:GbsR/MarR family transcriptional regulator [Puniceicoccus vermicola]|uniref:HTH-type transcriptional regulator n=1 Tax=Puniceicoccus vermicola TaxID=388746 RepID=A0A7X1B0W1_9BACT|nr:MarR family transcriptional regulator [Puniceicoccus vermicola]MBC2603399.1 transcriptional regulator [Puniceicoccus vermicola]
MKDEDFQALRNEFIAQWGTLGGGWGINRTMAQIHALLMVSVDPLDTNVIMTRLKISRGNANANLRDLVGWGLIRRVTYPGDRKEYFEAEKDVWTIFCTIARERKRREIDPALNLLRESSSQSFEEKDREQQLFGEQTRALADFLSTADQIMGRVARSEKNKVIPFLLKRFK